MATRRSCRLLNKKSVTPALEQKPSLDDMDIDDGEMYPSSSSASDDEYKPPRREVSSDEFQDDVPQAKKIKHKDVEPTQASESSGDEPFELENLEVNLSEGGTSSDEFDDGRDHLKAEQKKSSKKISASKKQFKQKVKIPKLSEIRRASNTLLASENLNRRSLERALHSHSLSGGMKSSLGPTQKQTSVVFSHQGSAAMPDGTEKVEDKEDEGKGKPTDCLKDVISAMLLENEPQATCSYTQPGSPKQKRLKNTNKLANNVKQPASNGQTRSPVKTRSRHGHAAQKAVPPALAARNKKHADKSSSAAGSLARSTGKKLKEGNKQQLRDKKMGQRIKHERSDSSSESDWEEVPEEADLDSYAPKVPESGITITLQQSLVTGKQKKSKFDPVAEMRRRINRVRKEVHGLKHKVHLLCLLAHGLKLNSLIMDQTLHGVTLSLLTPDFLAYAGKPVTFLDVERLTRLFCKVFVCKLCAFSGIRTLHDDITKALANKVAQSAREYVLLFLVIVRCLHIEARFCMSLYPVPLDAVQLLKTDSKPEKKSSEPKQPSKKKVHKVSNKSLEESDSDFEEEKLKESKGKKKLAESSSGKKGEKSGKDEEKKLAEGTNDCIEHWVEVFTPKDSKWIPVDVVHGSVGSITESHIREPVCYVLSFDDSNKVKDITTKFASGWLTSVKKKRIDPKWWEESLKPFSPAYSERERVENTQIQSKLQRQPMPASVAEFKNHPLYALKRHLLKFEAIYPPDAPTLGFVRGEPVYARECVHVLRSRETWLREARMVRVKEQPYKVVKARPRYDKLSGQILKEQPLELFGHWQTEPYMPPIAFNGKVPRNEWGNVELFKSCMLPIGTVHLRAPGLARVAAKLNIDCVPAVVGFEGHCRGVHPVFDGWVVCEEFQDTLMAAWEEEQANISNREEEKRLKRVYGNWKKLIKAVLIRERLRTKYRNGDD
ncbi:DNA repair protein complementing XP-C cells homolog [Amblyomma americanum]